MWNFSYVTLNDTMYTWYIFPPLVRFFPSPEKNTTRGDAKKKKKRKRILDSCIIPACLLVLHDYSTYSYRYANRFTKTCPSSVHHCVASLASWTRRLFFVTRITMKMVSYRQLIVFVCFDVSLVERWKKNQHRWFAFAIISLWRSATLRQKNKSSIGSLIFLLILFDMFDENKIVV